MAALAVAVSPPTVKGSSLNTPLKARRQRNCFQKKKGGTNAGDDVPGGQGGTESTGQTSSTKTYFWHWTNFKGLGQARRTRDCVSYIEPCAILDIEDAGGENGYYGKCWEKRDMS